MAGWIAAGASLIGDVMSQQGQQSTNSSQMAFNAQQAQLNRDFQQKETLQVEGWEQQNSDTAMQRRVTDLKAAGLNPLLAISQGGASQPSVGVPSGSSASASPQNPNAAFSNLGAQVSSAQQLQSTVALQTAQADAAKAQADKTRADTGQGAGDAQVNLVKSQTGLNNISAEVVKNNVEYVASQIANVREDTALKNIQYLLGTQNYQNLVATSQALIHNAFSSAQLTANQANIAGSNALVQGNQGDIAKSPLGKVLAIINAILEPVNTAASAAAKARGVLPTLNTAGPQ